MPWLFLMMMLAGFYPWTRAWLAVSKTSLVHALAWALAAWLGWTAAFFFPESGGPRLAYVALCLTGCAGVAVLGARRPHVAAWNFVVAGLLAVMALPLLEDLVLGGRPIGPVRLGFLAATLLVVLGNFVPTSFAAAALFALLGCAGQMWLLLAGQDLSLLSQFAVALVPWVGWICWALRPVAKTQLAQHWLDFRDRFGAMWGLRVREQFNRTAEHAGWPVLLTWSGVTAKERAECVSELDATMAGDFRALVKRFTCCS